MRRLQVRSSLLLIAGASLLAGGCASVKDHKGYIMDQALVATVQPGIDNKDSVEKTLGRPSFVGEFDPSTWYYLSRNTRQYAFGTPHAVQQDLLTVRFDPAGNVARVEKGGMQDIVSIHPYGERTPTLGRKHNFFSDLFGNIGRVGGTGPAAGTADNPN